jgi:surface antigen
MRINRDFRSFDNTLERVSSLKRQKKRLFLFLSGLMVIFTALVGFPVAAQAETGGYPYANGPTCANGQCTADPWRFYQRECVSFVAWKLNTANNFAFKNDFDSNGTLDFRSASNWKTAALSFGYTVNMTPAPGSVAWWSSNHVAWVESVNGTQVTIQEYNYGYTGKYNRRTIPISNANGYIHFKDIVNSPPPPPPVVNLDKPAAIELPSGQVDTFTIAPNGSLKLKYWNDNTGFSTWMDWGNPGVSLIGSPVPILEEGDKLHAFVRGSNNRLYERYWAPDVGLSSWIDWGGTGVASTPTAAILADGKIHVWVRGTDGYLYEQFQTQTGLSGWISWDKPPTSTLAYDPVVSIGAGGSVQVYSAGADYHLYERFRDSDGTLSPWIDWGGTGVKSTPAVLQEGGPNNKVDVWVVGSDGNLWERYWQTDGFSSWIDWGNPGVRLLNSPAVIQDSTPEANGQIDVWVRGSNNRLYERYWSNTSNSLSPWIDWGGTGVASTPTVIQEEEGQIDVFVQGTDYRMWEQYWSNETVSLSGWVDWG